MVGDISEDSLIDPQELKHNGIWQVDYHFFPEVTQDEKGERPYFPYAIIWADDESGEILNVALAKPDEWGHVFLEMFDDIINESESLPRKIRIRKEDIFDLMEKIASQLEIELEMVEDLSVIDEAQDYVNSLSLDDSIIGSIERPPEDESHEMGFLDEDRAVREDYDLLCAEDMGITQFKLELEDLIEKDPNFLDSYITLVEIFLFEGRLPEANKLMEDAYQRALNLITDEEGNWPFKLGWGWVGNRHIIKTILNKGIALWKDGKKDEALDLFQKLLRSNPDDNPGVRMYILAIRMKMSFKKFEKRFNRGGYYDNTLTDWFEKNHRKYPDEFGWWDELMKD
jgi:tetratricopeptide (TPR) repeat protein